MASRVVGRPGLGVVPALPRPLLLMSVYAHLHVIITVNRFACYLREHLKF